MSYWDTPAGREGLAAWRAERADLLRAIDRLPCAACRRTHEAFDVAADEPRLTEFVRCACGCHYGQER